MACRLLLDLIEDSYDFSVNGDNINGAMFDHLHIYLSDSVLEIACEIDHRFKIDIYEDGNCTLRINEDDETYEDYGLNTNKLQQMINYFTRQITGNTNVGILSSVNTTKQLMIELYERFVLITNNHPLTQELLDELCNIPSTKSAAN